MKKNSKKKILIVEDDLNFLSILQKKLGEEGFLVFTAQDGREGFSLAQKEKFDLIISDLLLPLMDGWEMIEKIKKENPELPVILLTNIKEKYPPKNIQKLRKVKYLIKSEVHILDIVKEVNKFLK